MLSYFRGIWRDQEPFLPKDYDNLEIELAKFGYLYSDLIGEENSFNFKYYWKCEKRGLFKLLL